MIKVGAFKFEEIPAKNHWATFARFGDVLGAEVEHYDNYREVPELLSEGKAYQISLDQSTTNTGMFIKSYDNTEAFMVEFAKEKYGEADDYIFNLEMLIHHICEGHEVTHLIYERPIESKNFRSSQVLFQLEGNIRALKKRYREFSAARLEYIENSSWRRVVICPQHQDLEKKRASEASIRTIFPWTTSYGPSLGKDRDIFEALGVMFGWFMNSFDELGRPYVRGDRYSGNIGGFMLPDVSAEEVSDQLREAGLDSFWVMQNPRKSTYENLACAVQKHKVVCVEISSLSAMLALTIECGFKWQEPEKITVLLTAANYVDSRLFEITGDEYHFIL